MHVGAVFATLALVVIADLHGLWWLLGKHDTLPSERIRFLHKAIFVGLGLTILAGAMLFSYATDYYLSLIAFRFKLLFVFALGINAFLIGKHMELTFSNRFVDLSSEQKRALLISGAVSTLSWIGAFTAAQFLE